MTSLTRKTLTLLLALSLSTGLALSAAAKEVRHPAAGSPAFQFQAPDDWTSTVSGPNLGLSNSTGTASMLLLVLPSTDAPDVLAAQVLKEARAILSAAKQPAEISGRKGSTWFASMTNPQGITLKLEITIVQVDSSHIASVSLVMTANVSAAQEAEARRVRGALKLIPAVAK